MGLSVYLESLGCKLNQCECNMLASQLSEAGYTVVERVQDADLCVVNTCAVTQAAAGKSRRRARQLQRLNPTMRFVATGCYASVDGLRLQADLVVPNDLKSDLPSLIEAQLDAWGIRTPQGVGEPTVTGSSFLRTRPLIKIQDGCDNVCAYCIVRSLRGRQQSRPRSEILAEVTTLLRQGYHEIVLTGVHIGSYGSDVSAGDNLAALVHDILDRSPTLGRLRLSSIEPWDISSDFFALWQDPRLCRHLHLPLQSGCDATLQRMNRHYTTTQFEELVAHARQAIPGLAVTTDVIAGFPGETEEEFAQSIAFVTQMAFARVHVFPYSERPGTPAALMPEQVRPEVRQARARQVKKVAHESGRAFREQFLGCVMPVLWERQRVSGRWSGLTDNYIRVSVHSDQDLFRRCLPARMVSLAPGRLEGELVESNG